MSNTTHRVVHCIHLITNNDSRGNPRRLYQILSKDFYTIGVVNEGYRGSRKVLDLYVPVGHQGRVQIVANYNVPVSEYNAIIREAKESGCYYE